MATYINLKDRIARELHRNDLTANIAEHVISAVAYYAGNRFAGNEKRGTITTIAATKYYGTTTASPGTLPGDINEIDSIVVTANNRTYQLELISYDDLEKIDAGVTPLTGYPRLWAWYANQIRLYPTPNAAYVLTLSYQYTLTALSADSTSNFWTNEAEQLIRARAKKTLALDVTYDASVATTQAALEKDALASLKSDTNKLISSGRLRSTRF